MTDMVEDLEEMSKADAVEGEGNKNTFIEKVEKKFDEIFNEWLPDVPIVGDLIECWDLFRWLKLERKAFNNIQWYKAYRETVIKFGGSSSVVQDVTTWVNKRFGGKPEITMLGKFKQKETLDVGVHIKDGTAAWLELPLDPNIGKGEVYAIDLNQAINIAKPYLPNWIEIYATYVATGNRGVANKMYKYYKDPNNLPLEITLYYLLSITEEEKADTGSPITTYYCKIDDTEEYTLTQTQYEELLAEAESQKTLLEKLGDAFKKIGEWVKKVWDKVIEKIKEFLGFYITIEGSWVPVVTKGCAYDYTISQSYTIGYAEEVISKTEDKVSEKNSETFEMEQEEKYIQCNRQGKNCREKTKKVTHKYKIRTEVSQGYTTTVKNYYHKLEYAGAPSIEEYEERTRYNYVFNKVIEKHDLDYTLDDVAMAGDVVTAYCSEKYGMLGNVAVRDFVLAGDLNASIVKFATQFDGKTLLQMKAIDDTGTFWDAHWCAMFVTYCMKKANVPVAAFSGCSTFWNNNKGKPGFYDISTSAGAKNGGWITNDRNHIAYYEQIQPGDILLFRWNNATTARSHTGIAVSVEKDASGKIISLTAVEGNTGGSGAQSYYNSKVNIKKYTPGGGNDLYNIVSFVSISKLMDENKKGNAW